MEVGKHRGEHSTPWVSGRSTVGRPRNRPIRTARGGFPARSGSRPGASAHPAQEVAPTFSAAGARRVSRKVATALGEQRRLAEQRLLRRLVVAGHAFDRQVAPRRRVRRQRSGGSSDWRQTGTCRCRQNKRRPRIDGPGGYRDEGQPRIGSRGAISTDANIERRAHFVKGFKGNELLQLAAQNVQTSLGGWAIIRV